MTMTEKLELATKYELLPDSTTERGEVLNLQHRILKRFLKLAENLHTVLMREFQKVIFAYLLK